jgi:hypothetical protein
MSSFLSGIGRAIRAPGFGDRLQAALAAAGGDAQAITRLHALQRQQQADKEASGARDAQVIGAKELGIGNDEIGALSPGDLSRLALQRIAARQFDPGGAPVGGGELGGTPPAGAATQLAPDGAALEFAPPPGAPPPGASFTLASARFPGPAGFGGEAMQERGGFRSAAFPVARRTQMAALGNLPRAQSHAQAASLPRGAFFFAPDGSIRRNA